MSIEAIKVLRDQATEALKSSSQNGEYNSAFYVAHIVLSSLADALEALTSTEGQRP